MANEIITNRKNKERPYSCPKCGGDIEKKEDLAYSSICSIDPVDGGESREREDKMHEVVDVWYYCIAEKCDWEKSRYDLYGESKQQTPEPIPTACNIVIPSPV